MKNAGKVTVGLMVLWLGLLLMVFSPEIGSAIPQKINYQGYLTTAEEVPLNGPVEVVFSIYNAPSGTPHPLWTETHMVSVTNGVFEVILGEGSPPVPIELAFDLPYYLGIRVGRDGEMTPRKPLTGVGYAFRAKAADTVEGSGSFTSTIVSTVPTGTVPLQISSTTNVRNLSADFLDGQHGSYYLSLSNQTGTLEVSQGGTGATTAPSARTNLGAAMSGANMDITSLSGLSIPLSIPQGGTGATSATSARTNLGVAKAGANSDITSLSGLTTPLSVPQGGTGSSSKNFVDLSSSQTVTGTKTFSDPVISSVSTGTAPFHVASETMVTNFNSEMLGGQRLADLDIRYGQAAPVQSPRSNTITTVASSCGGLKIWETSITIGTDGLPVIVYGGGALMVVKCGNAACSSGNTTTIVDDLAGMVYFLSIAIGTDDFPVVSYYDVANQSLKVAKCGNAACSSGNYRITMDFMGDVGLYTSIAIGTDGLPVVSYYDKTNQGLKVAKCGNAACSLGNVITTVDSAVQMGLGGTSIAIGTDGFPIISYGSHGKVAKCGNHACSSGNTITSSMSGGNRDSIAIGADSFPVISSPSEIGGVFVSKCDNTACSSGRTSATVDSAVGTANTSITIGTDGFPVISYRDSTNQNLKVAKCGNAACSLGNVITTVDSAGDVGHYTSITIGTDGFPVISYHDGAQCNLKVAKCANPFCLNNWSRR
jgi:hypothetical protein